MKKIKNITIFFLITIIYSLLVTTFKYFNIVNETVISILNLIYMLVSYLVIGYIHGKKAKEKGYRKGALVGLTLILITVFFSLIFGHFSFNLKKIIYYIILLITAMLGATIGINRGHKQK